MRLRHWALLLAAFGAEPACANGLTATANGAAQAEVMVPLTVTREADLDFGTIFATSQPGEVAISSTGSASYAGGAQSACGGAACANPHTARFSVQGEPGRSYAIALPQAIIATGTTADGTGAAPPLTVDALSVRTASRPAAGPSGQLDAQGIDRFEIGGTLRVPAGLSAARYRATIAVVVSYG